MSISLYDVMLESSVGEVLILPWPLFEGLPNTDKLELICVRQEEDSKLFNLEYEGCYVSKVRLDIQTGVIEVG